MNIDLAFTNLFNRKLVVLTTAFAAVFLMSLLVYPLIASASANNATIVTQPADVEFRPIVGHRTGAVFAVATFSLKDADVNPDDTLDSVAVTVTAGSPAVVVGDFTSLSIYKDDGDGLFSANSDTLLGSAQTTVNIGSATTINTGSDTLSGSASAATYYVVATLATSAADGHKFTVDLATDGIVVSGAALTSNALTGQTTHLIDTTAPVVTNTYPANNDTNVPLSSFFNVMFTEASGEMDPSTIVPTNITFTKNGSAVPFSLRHFPIGFDLIPSGGAPTWAASSRYAKPWNITNAFANFSQGGAVNFDSNYTPTVGDMVLRQTENFPPEFGIVTNANLTGGTFAVNDFPLYGPTRLLKFATPDATGAVNGATSVNAGDLILINASANPNTNYWYDWAIVTTGAAINNSALRLDGNVAAPTFAPNSSFSAITPDATATDNGATTGGVLNVSLGDLVYVQLAGGTYAWHIVTTAGNLSSDTTEGTGGLDGALPANSLVEANSQMSKIIPVAQGAVSDSTNLNTGDIIFANAVNGAANTGAYNFHFASLGGAVNGNDLRLDNAPANLTAASTYTVTIGTGVKDLAGNALTATSTISFSTSSNDPTDIQIPPAIVSSQPAPGTSSFSPNGNLYVEFIKGEGGKMLADGTANAINTATNVLLQLAVAGEPSGNPLATTLTWDATTHTLKINPNTNLTANTEYILTIKKNVVNEAGLAFGGTGTADYILFFTTGATADTIAPTVTATDPKNADIGVLRNLPSVRVQFSEAIDASTLDSNSIIVWKDDDGSRTLNGAETAMTVSRNYDAPASALNIGLQTLLDQDVQYCVKASADVKDITGNALTAATNCFTTINAHFNANAPTIMFADADTYRMWVEFDQSVDFTTGPFGALNKQNYVIENPLNTQLDLNSATFSARPEARAVEITGISLQPNTQFKVTVKNVKEASGSLSIVPGTGDTARGTVMDASDGGNFGSFDMKEFDQKNMGSFWISPERCEPQNRLPEQSSKWRCEFPAPIALTTGATIIFSFPAGFDVTNADVVAASESWDNQDMNGWGPGTTTVSATSTNIAARAFTVTINHSGDAMLAGDQLMLELKDIVNPATAGEKTVTAIIKDNNGVKVGNTISFAPFNILAAGSYSISGTLCKSSTAGGTCAVGDTGIDGVKIMLDSMRGMGHFETTTAGGGNYSFSGLNDGDYGVNVFLSMDTTGMNNLGGGSQFKQINVNGADIADVDFKLADLSSSGKTLTTTVSGLPANEDFDLFCDASGFDYRFSAPVMKKGTANASGNATVTLKLQANTTYQCAIGPHIPLESFSGMGPPPMPTFTFMPPPPQTVAVADSDVAITFALVQAGNDLKVKVVKSDGSGIPNVYVDAFPVGGKGVDSNGNLFDMEGSFGQTQSDGTATLKLTTGTYNVNACAPGMPCPSPTIVDVKANSDSTDGNLNADVYKDGTLLTGDGLTIKLAQSSITIAGQLQDENGNGLSYGFVDAEQVSSASDTCSNFTPKGMRTGSPTDSNGNFTVYMPPYLESDTTYWLLRGNSPAYGEVGCKGPITMSGTSKTGQNIKAAAADFGKLTITAEKGGIPVEGAFVGAYGPNGGNHGKTGSDGTVTLTMKAGTYTADGNLPGAGPFTPVTGIIITAGQTATTTLSVGTPGTVSIDLGNAITDAFCSVTDTNGRGDFSHYEGTTIDLQIPAGNYTVECDSEFTGRIKTATTTVVANQTNSFDWSSETPTLYTISGEIEDENGANLSGATVTFTDQSNGRQVFVQTSGASGDNANLSVSLPAGTWSVQSMKSGYNDNTSGIGRPEVIVISDNTTISKRTMAQASADNVFVTVQDNGSNFGGDARIIATRSDGKVVFKDVDSTVTSGPNVTLSLGEGTWTIEVKTADGREDGTPATVVVDSSGVADNSPTLDIDTSISGFTYIDPTNKTLFLNSGGTITDDNIPGLSVDMDVVDANNTTAGTLEMKQAPEMPLTTASAKMVGITGYSITPKNSSGRELHDATGIVKMAVSNADLETAGLITDASTATDAEITAALAKVKIGHLNALGEYEALSTTATKDAVASGSHLLVARTTGFSDFAPITAADNAPSTPTGLTATANGQNQIDLSWTASSGATSYDIYRSTNASAPVSDYARVGSEPTTGAVTSYSDTGLTLNTTYYYAISAINNSGESAASSAVNAKTAGGGGGSIGGGGVVSAAPVLVPTIMEIKTAEAAKIADIATNVDSATQALKEVAATPIASYTDMTLENISLEIKRAVTAISTIVNKGELTPSVKTVAISAVKNLLIGTIQLTLNLVKAQISVLLAS